MADLRRDRGQLILVTGIVIAVAMVALVLLLNVAIYTENLATRGTDVGESDALSYRSTVIGGTGGALDRENFQDYVDRGNLEENVTADIGELDRLLTRTEVDSGASASINQSTVNYADGELVRQTDSSRNFTDESGLLVNWTVAFNTSHSRKVAATVNRSALVTANDSDLAGTYRLVLSANLSTTEWHAYVYENRSTGEIAVAVKNGTESISNATEVCSVDADNATVGFTNGTLAGEPCPGLDWARGLSPPYDIEHRNGDNVAGTYHMIVRTEGGGSLNLPLLNDLLGGSPYRVPAVYSVTTQVSYETSELEYHTTVRVAPGEPDD